MTKQAILLASFGSADDEIRAKTFDKLAAELSAAFPVFAVRQAFTSNFMIRKLARRGISIDTPQQAIDNLRGAGFGKIFLLPTHLTPGEEFDNKIQICAAGDVEIIPPLMSEPLDEKILATILDCFKRDDDEDLILIGHGSPHRHNPVYENLQRLADEFKHDEASNAQRCVPSRAATLSGETWRRVSCSAASKAAGSPHRHNPVYENLQRLADEFKHDEASNAQRCVPARAATLSGETSRRVSCSADSKAAGSPHRHNPVYESLQRLAGDRVHIGVIEPTDTPNFADVLKRLQARRADKIVLAPLLFNGGVHVAEDIAGDGDSWLTRLSAQGYRVRVIRDGLGSFESFRRLYVDKFRRALIAC